MAIDQFTRPHMAQETLYFDHIHLISDNPETTAQWYVEILGGTIQSNYELRSAPQINVKVGNVTLLIRGKRQGEQPERRPPMQDFGDYSSHNVWGTDHFGFVYQGDLKSYCSEIRSKGAELLVEPWEFTKGTLICYLKAPDGVSIEIVQAR